MQQCEVNTLVSYSDREEVRAFLKHHADKYNQNFDQLLQYFSNLTPDLQVIAGADSPTEHLPWHIYANQFITEERIALGKEYWQTHQKIYIDVEKEFGVPANIILAILAIETTFGLRFDDFNVLRALSTLAFDYPRRSNYFINELSDYLLLTYELNRDPRSLKGTWAGALGVPNFMPISYRFYAVAHNRKTYPDLFNNPGDIITSVANYLLKNHWQRGGLIAVPAEVSCEINEEKLPYYDTQYRTLAELATLGIQPLVQVPKELTARYLILGANETKQYWLTFNNFHVIYRYNHYPHYCMAAYQLSQLF